jgi:hypothetical protein
MKKTLLITLLLIPFLGISQTLKPIEGFLGIKFGSTKAVVIAAMKAKGAMLNKDNSGVDHLDFDNVKLGHRLAVDFVVKFIKDKAYSAVFAFKAEEDPKTIEYYDGLVSDINGIYGSGTPTSEFKSPFKNGDGHETLAIEQGYADLFTDWQSGTNSIQASITSKLDIIVLYQNDTLYAEAQAAEKAKEKSDF